MDIWFGDVNDYQRSSYNDFDDILGFGDMFGPEEKRVEEKEESRQEEYESDSVFN
jgi:hypothetical protein